MIDRRIFDRRRRSRRALTVESLEIRQVLSTIYYIDSVAGKDVNPGTSPDAAWGTLAKARSKAFLPGDTILLKRGSVWNTSLDATASGAIDAPITFGAYGSGAAPQVSRISIVASNTIFENILVDHGMQTKDAVDLHDASNVTLRNMEVRNGAWDGIDASRADGLLIDGLLIHHFLAGSFADQKDAHGIVVSAAHGVTIRNTEVHHVSGDSFQADPDRTVRGVTDVLIENCEFWTSPSMPISTCGWRGKFRARMPSIRK